MLILATASKARRKLLDQTGIKYKAIVSNIDENIASRDPKYIVEILAEEKAKSVASKILLDQSRYSIIDYSAILGCDSLFEFDGEIYGKPKDEEEAIRRWKKMSGSFGVLHTGHCIFYKPNSLKFNIKDFSNCLSKAVVSTKIEFVSLTDEDIYDYVRKSGEPLKCAGGFAIEGKGALFIKRIEGCFSNVIGLSLPWLKEHLK